MKFLVMMSVQEKNFILEVLIAFASYLHMRSKMMEIANVFSRLETP